MMRVACITLVLAACGSHKLAGVNDPSAPQDPPECGTTIATTVLGAADIEDAGIWQGSESTSSGASTYFALGRARRHVLRVATDAIPDGEIIAFRLSFTAYSVRQETLSEFYRISDANEWIEGTADYAPQAGSVSWNEAGQSPWAGSRGCGTPVADYDPDEAPPSLVVTAPLRWAAELRPEWLTDWRDGNRVNNGVLWVSVPVPGEDANDAMFYSSESDTDPLSFEIDYVANGGCE